MKKEETEAPPKNHFENYDVFKGGIAKAAKFGLEAEFTEFFIRGLLEGGTVWQAYDYALREWDL